MAAFIVIAVYQLYLNQWLQIRWRTWMTRTYLGDWLDGANHYRMQLLGDAADNPDQRIAEDIKLFIEKILYLGLGLLNAVVTLGSFVVILWILSAAAPFTALGVTWSIPGYLVWAALLPIVSVWGFQFDGVFIGATRTRELLVTMAVAAAAFWGLSVMLQPLWGNHGLWVSMLGFMALRGLMLGALLPRVWRAA